MRNFFSSLWVLLPLVTMLVTMPATAAELIRLSSEPLSAVEMAAGECTHVLRGDIVQSDVALFKREIADLPEQLHDDRNFVLCLDSPGGNLGAALKIGTLIRGHMANPHGEGEFFATYVPEGATCLSACAVLFMHGVAAWIDSITNYRMMHPTASLGFHAPSLMPGGDPASLVPLERVWSTYGAAMQHISELADRGARTAWDSAVPVIPLTLLKQMLSHDGANLFHVSLLHHAFLWDIRIQGQETAIGPDFDVETGYAQICDNAVYGEIDGPGVDEVRAPATSFCDQPDGGGWFFEGNVASNSCGPVRLQGNPLVPDGHFLLTELGMGDIMCGVGTEDGAFFEVRRYDYETLLFQKTVPALFMLPPSTPITSLAR